MLKFMPRLVVQTFSLSMEIDEFELYVVVCAIFQVGIYEMLQTIFPRRRVSSKQLYSTEMTIYRAMAEFREGDTFQGPITK